MSESRQVALRQNGDATTDKTRAIWAGADAKISAEVGRALGVIGETYGLDPALGEVMILGNKVYITFEGYLRIAEQHPAYEGYELRPMTADERKAMKVGEDESAFVAHVYRKDRRFPSVGYGVASNRTVLMSTMQAFLREVAEKRAFHRALKMAFRAGIPDYDEALEAIESAQAVRVSVPDVPRLDVAPSDPQPDWPYFWSRVKELGVSREEAHTMLGVGSIKELTGSLDEALGAIHQAVAESRQSVDVETGEIVEAPKPAAPVPPPLTRHDLPALAGNIRATLDKAYDAIVDKADVVGVPADTRDPRWSDQEIAARTRQMRAKVQAKEAAIPANA